MIEHPSTNQPSPQPPFNFKNEFSSAINKIIRAFNSAFIYTGLSELRAFRVNRKSIMPAQAKMREDFKLVSDYVKYRISSDNTADIIYLFDYLPNTQLNEIERKKRDNAKIEIPEAVLKIAKHLSFKDLPKEKTVTILSAELEPINDEENQQVGEQLSIKFLIEDSEQPLAITVGCEKFGLTNFEALILPELLQEALNVFGITTFVQEE